MNFHWNWPTICTLHYHMLAFLHSKVSGVGIISQSQTLDVWGVKYSAMEFPYHSQIWGLETPSGEWIHHCLISACAWKWLDGESPAMQQWEEILHDDTFPNYTGTNTIHPCTDYWPQTSMMSFTTSTKIRDKFMVNKAEFFFYAHTS